MVSGASKILLMIIILMMKRLEEEGSINSRIIQVDYADDYDDDIDLEYDDDHEYKQQDHTGVV